MDLNTNNFLGLKGFVFWFGTVENRIDPLKLGRCQVRIQGWHNSNKTEIPSEDLPWAHPILSLNSLQPAALSIKDGDIVFGFFLDCEEAQFPIILGIVPGIPEILKPSTEGFTDQRTEQTLPNYPRPPESKTYNLDGSGITITNANTATRYPNILNEPTTPRIARNENISNTFIQERRTNVINDIPTANEEILWSEPETEYNTRYPFNKVITTESGHIIEIDDTPGAERIQIAHRSGTFSEFFPDGKKVEKTTKGDYKIILENGNLYILGDYNITVNGETRFYSKGNFHLKTDGDLTIDVGGDMYTNVTGKSNVTIQKTLTERALEGIKAFGQYFKWNQPGE